jgi:hypothetical protein
MMLWKLQQAVVATTDEIQENLDALATRLGVAFVANGKSLAVPETALHTWTPT